MTDAVWKRISLIVFTLLFQVNLLASEDKDKQGNEIDFICSCVDDCDRVNKCSWIFDALNSFARKNSKVEIPIEIEALQKQELFLLEIVDYGWGGCFSTYGVLDSNYYRIDAEIESNKPLEITEYRIENITEVPSLEQRKITIDTDEEDNTCLFRLPKQK